MVYIPDLQEGDKVKAWNRKQDDDQAYIAATVTKDNGNGTFAVEYEDPTQVKDGLSTNGALPKSHIQDYK